MRDRQWAGSGCQGAHPRATTSAALIALLATLVTACVSSTGPSPAGSPSASAPPVVMTSPTTSAAPPSASAVPEPAAGALDPSTPTACLDLAAPECARARDLAAAVLTADDPAIAYVQVGPFGCAVGERCAETLAARPEGDVILEFPGGTGISVHVRLAPDGSATTERSEAMGVAVPPSSAAGLAAGPTPFTLGHCGIFSGIDLDGAWWDPVGPVSMASGEAVNATSGTIVAADPNHATFTTPSGFALQLQRRAGSRLLPFCM